MSLEQRSLSWISKPGAGFDGMYLDHNRSLPDFGATSCLVRIEAVSLNHRDIAIPVGTYPTKSTGDIVPCSDAAGTIVSIGKNVTRFKVGDQVCTIFNPTHQSGYFNPSTRDFSLGSSLDGTLRKQGVFDETALVPIPCHLSTLQASTLPCAAVTAWNAFYGVRDRSLKPGDYVLTQGTGGVSLFAIQIALAVGATVIATTSLSEKAERLTKLGVQHVINYREHSDWGNVARSLTPGEVGVDHVIDVGGDRSLVQSMRAVKMEGLVSIIGFLDGQYEGPKATFVDFLRSLAIVRGTSVGSREQFEALSSFLESHKVYPIVDDKRFKFEEAPEAFRYYHDQRQWGKLVIVISP